MQQFNLLKKKTASTLPVSAKPVPIFLQLDFDDTGAFIQTVDAKGNDVVADFHNVSGRKRDLLRALSVIRQRQGFQVDWQGDGSNQVYVQDHDYLIELARQADCLQLVDGDDIAFSDQIGFLELSLSEDNEQQPEDKQKQLEWHLRVHTGQAITEGRDIRLLSERYILIANTIHEIESLGENFSALPLFQTSIAPLDLRNYLALVCSSFTGVRLRYLDYGQRDGQSVNSRPAITFEQVDSHEGLRLSVASHVEGYSPGFFHDYDISRIADINDMEKNVVV
ncbi:MAG: hypothetical protein KAI39_07025, partial [Desulfobulbaceae bacterium]|nr:hypothetical protein [Desulfobulbaceae bacterium]